MELEILYYYRNCIFFFLHNIGQLRDPLTKKGLLKVYVNIIEETYKRMKGMSTSDEFLWTNLEFMSE